MAAGWDFRRWVLLGLWAAFLPLVLVSVPAAPLLALAAPRHRLTRNLLLAQDQLGNALLGGDPDETLSSRMGKRLAVCRLCRWICGLLDRIEPAHCHKAREEDEGADDLAPLTPAE